MIHYRSHIHPVLRLLNIALFLTLLSLATYALYWTTTAPVLASRRAQLEIASGL